MHREGRMGFRYRMCSFDSGKPFDLEQNPPLAITGILRLWFCYHFSLASPSHILLVNLTTNIRYRFYYKLQKLRIVFDIFHFCIGSKPRLVLDIFRASEWRVLQSNLSDGIVTGWGVVQWRGLEKVIITKKLAILCFRGQYKLSLLPAAPNARVLISSFEEEEKQEWGRWQWS